MQKRRRHQRGILLLIIAILGLLTLVQRRDAPLATGAPPPLSLEGLLDEKLPDAEEPIDLAVDNSACYVCHRNLERDALVVRHGKAKVGCADCHGESLLHRNDEDNATPPDKMFGPDNIDGLCQSCHDQHDVPAREVISRWQRRCPQKTDPKTIVCTDCHFEHRLAQRVVRWDKKTGKLIVRPYKKTESPTAEKKKTK